MSFSRHTSRIYMDSDDVNGAINVLSKRISTYPEHESADFYHGALMLLAFVRNHEEIRDQSILMELFDRELSANGVEPIPAVEKGEEIEEG